MRKFAEERLHAASYPDCVHTFNLFECDRCEGDRFEPILERHPGDSAGDFVGLLRLRCQRCGAEKVGLGVTGGDPEPQDIQVEHPLCPCGEADFNVGLSERYEDWGFFDEGTVVACCVRCRRLMALLDTD